jgi:DNA-binding GntR family transcriptional regulator
MATRLAPAKARLSDTVYQAVLDMIVRATMAPGSRIAEAELCERLGVSRTPVREALLRLTNEGLVQMFPQAGIYVAPISVTAVNEAQFIREHLECAVIRDVAVAVDAAGMALLRATLMRQHAARDMADIEQFHELDELLHGQFSELAGRPGVWHVIQHSKHHLDRVRWLSLPMAEHIPRLIAQHEAIVDAVGRRDPDLAEASLRVHLREVYATIKQLDLGPDGGTLLPAEAAR